MSGSVVFNYAEWIVQYPRFSGVGAGQAQSYFNRAAHGGLIDNTPASPVSDLFQRTILLNLAVCHLAVLDGALNPSQAGAVGRLSSATQGSVSAQFDYDAKGGATAAWWAQTSYGAEAYAMMLPFRTGFYAPGAPQRPSLPYFGRFGLRAGRGF